MSDPGVVVLGIPLPSSSPTFLALVAFHVAAGLLCVVAGAVAMLSRKGARRHIAAGTAYFRGLVVVSLTMTALSVMRWPDDSHLLALGVLSMLSATAGRLAPVLPWLGWLRFHVTGMALSYIFLLTAFYVDNGKNLPLWRALPPIAFWLGPGLIGLPILVWALTRHPLVWRPDPRPRKPNR